MDMKLDINEILEKGPQLFTYIGLVTLVVLVLLYALQYVGLSIGTIPMYILVLVAGIIAGMAFKDRLGRLLGTLETKDIVSVIVFSAIAFAIVGTIVSLYGQVGMTASVLGPIEIPALLDVTKIVNLLINNAIIGGISGAGLTIGYAITGRR